MKKILPVIVLLSITFIYYGCRKEKLSPPDIFIDLPTANSTFSVVDTIPFRIRVTSEQTILNIHVYISDGDKQVFSDVETFNINRHATTLQNELILNDETLESGTYYFTVKVETEKDTYRQYSKINLAGVPQKMIGVAMALQDKILLTNDSLEVYTTALLGEPILDIKSVASKKSIMALTVNGNLYSYSLVNNSFSLEVSGLNNSINAFDGTMFFRKIPNGYELFFPKATGFGKIRNDIVSYAEEFPSPYQRPQQILYSKGFIYVATKSVVSNERPCLYQYYGASMSYYKTFLLDYNFYPKAIIPISQDEMEVWGNIQNTSVMYKIYTTENTVYQYDVDDDNALKSVWVTNKTSDGFALSVMISKTDGLYEYSTETDNLVYVNGDKPNFGIWDSLNNDIYVADSILYKYSYPAMQLINQTNVNSLIQSMDIIYNK